MTELSTFEITNRWPAEHPDRIQLYSFPTPNGVKASIALEEIGLPYEAHLVTLADADVKSPAFLSLNPNNKIPAIIDPNGPDGAPIGLFESGAILLYLAEKFDAFLPRPAAERAEVYSWLMWQMGTAPFIGGGFGHFYAYAPEKWEYPINRYAMETKRIFDVADKRLAESRFLAGDSFTIADMAAFPWLRVLHAGEAYNDAATFLAMHEYTHVGRWVAEISARPAVQRGLLVNREEGLKERHNASDFELLAAD